MQDDDDIAGLPRGVFCAMMRRRRLVVVRAALRARRQASGPRGPKRQRDRVDWQDYVDRTSPKEFRAAFRMTLESFNVLLDVIRPHISAKEPAKASGNSGVIVPEVRLAVALRVLAGGSLHDLKMAWHIYSRNEIYHSLWLVVDAINAAPEFAFSGVPFDDVDALNELEQEFAALCPAQVIRGAVFALDGCVFWQKNPGRAVHNPSRYHCERKKMYGLLVMAACSAKRKILWFDCSHTPTTHDHTAFCHTDFGAQIRDGRLPDGLFGLGDSAFVCGKSLITPGGNDDFNFLQSSLRINIECVFGEVVRRWGILWRPLEVEFKKRSLVLAAVFRLHNFCLDQREQLEEYAERWSDTRKKYSPKPFLDSDGLPASQLLSTWSHTLGKCEEGALKTRDTSLRDQLEDRVRAAGVRRPATR